MWGAELLWVAGYELIVKDVTKEKLVGFCVCALADPGVILVLTGPFRPTGIDLAAEHHTQRL